MNKEVWKTLKVGDCLYFPEKTDVYIGNQPVSLHELEGTVIEHTLGADTIAVEMAEYFEFLDEWDNVIYFSEPDQNLDCLNTVKVLGNTISNNQKA